MSHHTTSSLEWALERLARAQGARLDGLRMRDAIQSLDAQFPPPFQLAKVAADLGLPPPQWLMSPDAVHLPLLVCLQETGWGVAISQEPDGNWQVVHADGKVCVGTEALTQRTAVLNLQKQRLDYGIASLWRDARQEQGFLRCVYSTLQTYRIDILEACLATVFIGILALATSMFSMQVYDRVIPTRSEYTLLILASGVLLTILLELVIKLTRSHLMSHVIVGVDNRLSREVFTRLMHLRVDQVPATVGSLAGQIRGYEQVRAFYTSSTLFTLVDLPLGLLFTLLLLWLGHPVVAAVPLVFGAVGLYLGVSTRRKMMRHAAKATRASNLKTGLLVEAVEGIETIKSGWGGWRFLSRWVGLNQQVIESDMQMRSINENLAYHVAALQQISYALLVMAGAWAVIHGQMTMGSLIACSIISGRILAPVMTIPNLMVQHAHAQAALDGIEKLYQLKVDNEDVSQLLTPSTLRGHYQLTDVSFAYGDNLPSFKVARLEIQAGEQVVVVGPIGAGKSSLLRLLSGLYQPQMGRVLMDGLDLMHIHRQVVAQHTGYLQQDHRLFQGTLRENLLIGLPDPGDDALCQAMARTGMDRLVAGHPKGLDRPIMEGGKGLSGGQKQLLAFTRLVLTDPNVWLLDEPTATMDEEQEQRCLQVLAEEASRGKTLVMVTHKPALIHLAQRVIVVVGNTIVLDGPRDAVMARLAQMRQAVAGQARSVTPIQPA